MEGGGAVVDEVEVDSELVSERISGRISDISIKILSRGNLYTLKQSVQDKVT